MDALVTQMEYDVPFSAGFMYWCMSLNVCCWQSGVFVPDQRSPVVHAVGVLFGYCMWPGNQRI